MQSCQSSQDKELDEKIKKRREEIFKKHTLDSLLKTILPKLLLQGDITAFIDVSYGIDKRKIMAECLREVAHLLETKYTIEDIKGGFVDE